MEGQKCFAVVGGDARQAAAARALGKVLAASLFHYKELEIMDLKRYLADRGLPVRL